MYFWMMKVLLLPLPHSVYISSLIASIYWCTVIPWPRLVFSPGLTIHKRGYWGYLAVSSAKYPRNYCQEESSKLFTWKVTGK